MDWIYGRNVVSLALRSGARRRAHRIAATAPALKALGRDVSGRVPIDVVSAHQLEVLTGSRDHQGVALQVDPFPYDAAEDVLRSDLVVVLDEVTDPHNVGAVARSAAAVGAGGLVLPRRRSAAVTPAVVKASAGVIEHLPVAQVTNVVRFLEEAKKTAAWVYGAAGDAAESLWELDLSGRLVLVFGAEGRGLRKLVARRCDALAAIPMNAPVESLNVSVAAGLFMYEVRRQRSLTAAAPSSTPARDRVASAHRPNQ